jgi:hypothetical protein
MIKEMVIQSRESRPSARNRMIRIVVLTVPDFNIGKVIPGRDR